MLSVHSDIVSALLYHWSTTLIVMIECITKYILPYEREQGKKTLVYVYILLYERETFREGLHERTAPWAVCQMNDLAVVRIQSMQQATDIVLQQSSTVQ